MTQVNGALRWAAICVGVSAVAHAAAPVFGGFAPEAVRLLGIAVVLGLLAIGLQKGRRIIAYLAFFGVFFDLIFAAGRLPAVTDVPNWIYGVIAGADVLALAALFVVLWKSSPRTA